MAVHATSSEELKAEINVTPLVDVVLVLLIIFMVITPMLQKGVDVKLPTAINTKEKKDEQKTITVAVRKDSAVFLKGIRIENPPDIVPALKELLEEFPEGGRIVYLKADDGLAYSEVMKVMDLCREAGTEEVALIAERPVSQG